VDSRSDLEHMKYSDSYTKEIKRWGFQIIPNRGIPNKPQLRMVYDCVTSLLINHLIGNYSTGEMNIVWVHFGSTRNKGRHLSWNDE
jgi:hypothetical protein